MQTTAGIWIDHRRAVVVRISKKAEQVRRITSSVEKQLRRSGRTHPRATYESRGKAAGELREREFRSPPANFYDEVIACLDGATTILIFGSGDAKDGLLQRIEGKAVPGRSVSLATAAKMADAEIIAEVQKQIRIAAAQLGPKRKVEN